MYSMYIDFKNLPFQTPSQKMLPFPRQMYPSLSQDCTPHILQFMRIIKIKPQNITAINVKLNLSKLT